MAELIRAFILIFFAEMGDKTQILAMAFATKYKIKQVVIGIFIGSLLNHALAVLLGANLYLLLPIETLSIIAGASFILFGLWNLQMDDEEEEETSSKFGPIMTVSLAFFIGELGDKTQLTAIVLSTDAAYPLLILAGTVTGMVFTGLIGIFVGIKLGNKIDEFYIKIVASTIFFIFGYLKLFETLDSNLLTPLNVSLVSIIVITISTFLLYPTIQKRRLGQTTTFKRTAAKLHNFYNHIHEHLDDICLGKNICGQCSLDDCLVGYTKGIVKRALNGEDITPDSIQEKLEKGFKKEKVLEALKDVLVLIQDHYNDPQVQPVHIIRRNFEHILYRQTIDAKDFEEYMTKLRQIDKELAKFIK